MFVTRYKRCEEGVYQSLHAGLRETCPQMAPPGDPSTIQRLNPIPSLLMIMWTIWPTVSLFSLNVSFRSRKRRQTKKENDYLTIHISFMK